MGADLVPLHLVRDEQDAESVSTGVALSDGDLKRLAEHLAVALAPRLASPWRNAESAAAHLDCPLSRIRKLTAQGALPVHREGGRVLYHVDELDEFVRSGGAQTE